jgi:RimJ/RimL family protein N-acetyltransferase
MLIPVLETPRLRLREWRFEDVEPLAEINAHPEVSPMLGGPLDREGTEWQVAAMVAGWELDGFGLWAVEEKESRRFVGRIGLTRQVDFGPEPDPVEVGWTLHPDVWGRGLATEGAVEALRFGFEDAGLGRVVSMTLPHNVRSRRVMEKLGLTLVGQTFWREHDHVWYAIDRVYWELDRREGSVRP